MVRTNAIKILSGVDGCVRAIQAIKMELGALDASGRRRPTPVHGSEYEIDVDTVIEAIGNSPNPLIAATTPELQASKHGTIIVGRRNGHSGHGAGASGSQMD
jgi:glutamate synthase (NADPH/NADH) small chain